MNILMTLIPFAMASAVTVTNPQAPVIAQQSTPVKQGEMIARVGDNGSDRVDRAPWDGPSGQMLSAKIHSSLKRDKDVKSFAKNIDVENRNGQITLKGSVPTKADEMNVINKVRSMGGVAGVTSELSVTPLE